MWRWPLSWRARHIRSPSSQLRTVSLWDIVTSIWDFKGYTLYFIQFVGPLQWQYNHGLTFFLHFIAAFVLQNKLTLTNPQNLQNKLTLTNPAPSQSWCNDPTSPKYELCWRFGKRWLSEVWRKMVIRNQTWEIITCPARARKPGFCEL